MFRTAFEHDYWFDNNMSDNLELWQLVALHSRLDPNSMGETADAALNKLDARLPYAEFFPAWPLNRYLDNLEHAREVKFLAVDESEVPDSRRRLVAIRDFRQWATEVNLSVIDDWRLADEIWPWGSHTTHNLELLAYAGQLWRKQDDGGGYDERDIATAPTNDQIVERIKLIAPDASKKICQAIATILRSNTVKDGRRPKVSKSEED